MCIIERIYQLIDYKKDSVYKISKEIGVSNGYFSKTKAKNGSVGGDIIEKIVNYYTDVNVEWLITGEGSMLKQEHAPQAKPPDDKYLMLLEEHNKTLKEQLKDKEEKEALYKEKIQELQQRIQTNTVYQSGTPTASYSLSTPPAP
jgi:bacteriophage CI repressor helix-turn-helix domain|nr:MAG TPA: SOS-response transcriptional repressor [Caudoviricetes sp.]